jgi:hypothetical protein
MIDFSAIFESHYFSNHHTQAKQVEASLEASLPDYECVTFSSFAALIVSVAHEMCDEHVQLFEVSQRSQTRLLISSLNLFLAAVARKPIAKLADSSHQQLFSGLTTDISPDVLLIDGQNIKAAVLDLSYLHPMLAGAAAFVTRDPALAEKIRWARSSYGHRSTAAVKIAANGRLSEFQAMLMNASLKESA